MYRILLLFITIIFLSDYLNVYFFRFCDWIMNWSHLFRYYYDVQYCFLRFMPTFSGWNCFIVLYIIDVFICAATSSGSISIEMILWCHTTRILGSIRNLLFLIKLHQFDTVTNKKRIRICYFFGNPWSSYIMVGFQQEFRISGTK